MNRYAVFGQPISHSLSPRIHAAFGAQLGIVLDYRAIETGRDAFSATLAAFARDGGLGANVTLPLKEDAFALCATSTERARRCGSVNTLIREAGAWRGDSTDGIGFLRDLAHHGIEPHGQRVLLLGAGGAARAVAFALVDAGVRELAIANRRHERSASLAEALDADTVVVHEWAALDRTGAGWQVVVNATSAGHGSAGLQLPATLVDARTFCYDLSYGHAARAFLDWARAGGAAASDGLGMLVEQAAESFHCWHGAQPDTAPVQADLRALLDARG